MYGDPLSELHPADKALLKTPETATTPSRSHSHTAVPFLRRTEYIATEKHSTPTSTGNILRGTRRPSLQTAQQELDHVFEDPEAQIRMIDQMFKDADTNWIGKEHPRKRGIKCVDSWEVFPDRERIGQAFLLMRFQDDHISNFNVLHFLEYSDAGRFRYGSSNPRTKGSPRLWHRIRLLSIPPRLPHHSHTNPRPLAIQLGRTLPTIQLHPHPRLRRQLNEPSN